MALFASLAACSFVFASFTCGDACKYDPAAAKQLFTQSGGLPGNKIQLYYNADGGHKEWVDAVCNSTIAVAADL